MATNKRSPTPEQITAEDPDTAAARKELRQTVISEKPDLSAMPATTSDDPAPSAASGPDKASSKAATPDNEPLEAPDDSIKDHMSSPKKKRARDEVDESKDTAASANGDVSPIGTNGSFTLSRTNRSEPEKKRPRDVSSELKTIADAPITSSSLDDASSGAEKTEESATKPLETKETSTTDRDQKTTSTSAFNSSGLSGFATQSSPFLQAGGAKPLSSFASASTASSPFGISSSSKPSIFGASNGSSPFGQVAGGAPKTFGSGVFGGGLTSSLGESKLTNFGKPGESFKSSKPARPFGAPVSDEDDDEGGDDDNSTEKEGDDNTEKAAEEEKEKSVGADEKKRTKLQRVTVDNGEAGEVTILQVRAKMYHVDKASNSWKERGAGNLKINVPEACVNADYESGNPSSKPFDPEALVAALGEDKVVRLVMRQDSTHRVILNTVIIPAMEFQEKSTVKATCVLFTAIENEGAVSIQLKMSAANAKEFLNEVRQLQSALRKF